MKKIIKAFVLLLIGSLSLFSFSSCNSSNSTGDSKKDESGSSTDDDKKSGFLINLENSIDLVNVEATYVKIEDGIPTKANVEFGKKYEKNTKISVKFTNRSDNQVRVGAYSSNKKIKSYLLEGLDFDENPGVTELNDLVLDGDMTIKVELANDAEASSLNLTIDESKNTSEVVNTVHVYDPDTKNKDDLFNSAQLEVGQKLKVYVWNTATKVHLTIRNEDEIICDTDYDILTEEEAAPVTGQGHGDAGKFEFVVKGTVTVDLSVVDNDSSIKAFVASDLENTDYSYTVKQNNVDVTANEIAVNAGDIVVTTVTNLSNKTLSLIAYNDGLETIYDLVKINVGESASITVTISENVVFFIEEYTEYNLTINNSTSAAVSVYMGMQTLTSGDKIKKYSNLLITAGISSSSDENAYVIYITSGENTFVQKFDGKNSFRLANAFYVTDDLNITIVEYVEYDLTINNSYSDIQMYVSIPNGEDDITMLSNGDKIPVYSKLMVMAANFEQKTGYFITIVHNGITVVDNAKIEGMGYQLEDEFLVQGNVVITIEQK